MRKIAPILTAASVISTLATLSADPLSSIERFLSNEHDSEEYSDIDLDEQKRFAPFSPADSDLGEQLILKRYEGREPIRFELSSDYYWTDNIRNTDNNFDLDEGFIWKSRAAVSWRPLIKDNYFADFYAAHSFYEYDFDKAFSSEVLDFQRTDVRLGIVKILPDFEDLLLFARYEYARVDSDAFFDGAFESHRLRVGAHKVFFSSPRHTAYVALDYAHDLHASLERMERDEWAAHVGYTYQVTDKMRAVFYYHLAHYDYHKFNRNDTNQTLGTEIYWKLNKYTKLYASYAHYNNISSLTSDQADYTTNQAGVGISFTMRF